MNMGEIKACCKCTVPILNNVVMPKPYNGLEGEDFDAWYRQYDLYYCILGYTNELKCKIFPLYMMQRAEIFYHDLDCSITGDYHTLVNAFKSFLESHHFSLRRSYSPEDRDPSGLCIS